MPWSAKKRRWIRACARASLIREDPAVSHLDAPMMVFGSTCRSKGRVRRRCRPSPPLPLRLRAQGRSGGPCLAITLFMNFERWGRMSAVQHVLGVGGLASTASLGRPTPRFISFGGKTLKGAVRRLSSIS